MHVIVLNRGWVWDMRIGTNRTWFKGGCRCLVGCGGSRWWKGSGECWIEWGVCTCRHSDAELSRVLKWGWECERDSTFEASRSLLFIEMGECRAVVRHTCDRRLRNQGKCNRRWDIHGNVVKETLLNVAGRLNYSPLLWAPPSRGRDVLRVILPNAAFGLDLLLGLSSYAQVFDRSRTWTLGTLHQLSWIRMECSTSSGSVAVASSTEGFSNSSHDVWCNRSTSPWWMSLCVTGETTSNTWLEWGNSSGEIWSKTLWRGKLKELDDKDWLGSGVAVWVVAITIDAIVTGTIWVVEAIAEDGIGIRFFWVLVASVVVSGMWNVGCLGFEPRLLHIIYNIPTNWVEFTGWMVSGGINSIFF